MVFKINLKKTWYIVKINYNEYGIVKINFDIYGIVKIHYIINKG